MDLSPLGLTAATLPSPLPARRMQVSSGALLTACKLAKEQGARLVALWASDAARLRCSVRGLSRVC